MIGNWAEHKTEKWNVDDCKACIVLIGGFLLLLVSAFWGEWDRKEVFRKEKREIKESVQSSTKGMVLSQEQSEFLCQLEKFMEGASVHQAGRKLNQERKQLDEIWQTLKADPGGKMLFIRSGEIVPSLDGMGLAVREDDTCFYGNFRDGKPDGVCTAIACLEGKTSGYVYSMGLWKSGQMEGLGITGRYSWKKEKEEQGLEEQVSGIFQDDCLHGRLTYEQIDRKGRCCWWEIMAQEGRTCLDQRWIFWQALGEYRLLAEKEQRAFFVIPENLLDRVWWENKVPWKQGGE